MFNRFAFLTILLCAMSGAVRANTWTAATCGHTDVASAITSASEGDTVTIPAGTCAWSLGVTISKGLIIQGAGSGRIIAINQDVLTVATGTLSITIQAARADGTYPLGPTTSQTLRVFQVGHSSNWMQGTVTSFNSGTGALVMNITSTSGTTADLQQHHWAVATIPSTIIQYNVSGSMFYMTESTTTHSSLGGIKITHGTGIGNGASVIGFNYATNGLAMIVHDMWFEWNQADVLDSNTNRGLIYNCSFDASPYAMQFGTFDIKTSTSPIINSWTTASTWGSADTTGQGNFYIETNDYHGYLVAAANDDNGRLVFRYNFLDNAGFGTHGADTSPYGQRYVEYYNNKGLYTGYSDGHSTFNMTNGWVYIRGGSLVIHDNNLQAISGGSDQGPAPDAKISIFNLREGASGSNPSDSCWGAGTSGGARYHAPRQPGFGRVTGAGTDGLGRSSDETTYVGDSEPIYMWNNTRIPTVSVFDYSPNTCTSPDTAANYIVSGRDYFTNTAKPGYTPSTYPHPLAGLASPPPPPVAPATNMFAGTLSKSVPITFTIPATVGSLTYTNTVTVPISWTCSCKTNPTSCSCIVK